MRWKPTFVYVATSTGFPGSVRIGATSFPDRRGKQIASVYPGSGVVALVRAFPVGAAVAPRVEWEAHRALRHVREGATEWFQTGVEEASFEVLRAWRRVILLGAARRRRRWNDLPLFERSEDAASERPEG